MAATFDPDDFELRWPPRLFVDEANRLRRRKPGAVSLLGGSAWVPDIAWLLTEAFVSTEPADTLRSMGVGTLAEQWLSQLLGEAASWPEPGTRKPYWSTRTTGRSNPARMELREVSATSFS
jgi:hypothetical protein